MAKHTRKRSKASNARKGSKKESAAIGICMKSYSRKRVLTHKKFGGGLFGFSARPEYAFKKHKELAIAAVNGIIPLKADRDTPDTEELYTYFLYHPKTYSNHKDPDVVAGLLAILSIMKDDEAPAKRPDGRQMIKDNDYKVISRIMEIGQYGNSTTPIDPSYLNHLKERVKNTLYPGENEDKMKESKAIIAIRGTETIYQPAVTEMDTWKAKRQAEKERYTPELLDNLTMDEGEEWDSGFKNEMRYYLSEWEERNPRPTMRPPIVRRRNQKTVAGIPGLPPPPQKLTGGRMRRR